MVVASNLFADILTEVGAALHGGLGLAASANLNTDGTYPSMFEPVHGSAPDIAGRGIANLIGAIWSASLLLAHLGHRKEALAIVKAIERVLEVRGSVVEMTEEGAGRHLDELASKYAGRPISYFGDAIPARFAETEIPVICRIRPTYVVALDATQPGDSR